MNRLAALPLLIFGALTASLFAPVGTASASNAPDVIVRYADLDLSRPSDVERLYSRLQTAADSICLSSSPYELARYAAYQRCLQAVLDRAVSQVPSQALLALHRASVGTHHRGIAHS
jgi:UrcA family protein